MFHKIVLTTHLGESTCPHRTGGEPETENLLTEEVYQCTGLIVLYHHLHNNLSVDTIVTSVLIN